MSTNNSSCSAPASSGEASTVTPAPTSAEAHVLVVEHSDKVTLGVLGAYLQGIGVSIRTVRLYLNENFPNLSDASERKQILAVVSLGGPQGSYEEQQYPYLKTEKEFLRQVFSFQIPLLGICLGAQLMADAFGGKTIPAPKFEVGYAPLSVTHGEARTDPVLSTLFADDCKPSSDDANASALSFTSSSRPVLMHHGDTFTPPPSSTLLLRSHPNGFSAAFRVAGSCNLAVQFHPEATLNELTLWTSFAKWRYETIGTNVQKVLEEAEKVKENAKSTSEKFFEAWWKEVKQWNETKRFAEN